MFDIQVNCQISLYSFSFMHGASFLLSSLGSTRPFQCNFLSGYKYNLFFSLQNAFQGLCLVASSNKIKRPQDSNLRTMTDPLIVSSLYTLPYLCSDEEIAVPFLKLKTYSLPNCLRILKNTIFFKGLKA